MFENEVLLKKIFLIFKKVIQTKYVWLSLFEFFQKRVVSFENQPYSGHSWSIIFSHLHFPLFLINCGRTRDSRIRVSFFPCKLSCIVISKLYLVPVVSKKSFAIFFWLFKKDNNMTSIENFYILGLIFVYHKSITHTYQTFLQFNISALASVHPFVCMYIHKSLYQSHFSISSFYKFQTHFQQGIKQGKVKLHIIATGVLKQLCMLAQGWLKIWIWQRWTKF